MQKPEQRTNDIVSAISDQQQSGQQSLPPSKTPFQIRFDELKSIFEGNKNSFMAALPKAIPVDRMIRVVLTAINKQPKLLMCTNSSIVESVLQSCQLGLLPDSVTGEGYLVPFENSKKQRDGSYQKVMECQFIPGYRGLITLAYRSGMVMSFQARAVFNGDEFEYEFGLNEKLRHIPKSTDETVVDKITHVYAVVKLSSGGTIFDVMTRKQVEAIRRFSKSPNSPAWVNHYDEMSIKTVVRRASKRCPMSPELQMAISYDEGIEFKDFTETPSVSNQTPVGNMAQSGDDQPMELPSGEAMAQMPEMPFQFVQPQPISMTTKKSDIAVQQTLELLNLNGTENAKPKSDPEQHSSPS